jgi:hypothetical protein
MAIRRMVRLVLWLLQVVPVRDQPLRCLPSTLVPFLKTSETLGGRMRRDCSGALTPAPRTWRLVHLELCRLSVDELTK